MTTKEIADRLVALCRAGKNVEAVETLLSGDVVSVEAVGDEKMPAVTTGNVTIRGKNEWWFNNHKIHRARVIGPYPNGDRFAVVYDFEVTPLAGPMAGRRMRIDEVALYTVTDGKISREEFFYDTSGNSGLPVEKPAGKKARAKVKARKAPKKAPRTRAKRQARTKSKARTSKPKARTSKPKARTSKPKGKARQRKARSQARRR